LLKPSGGRFRDPVRSIFTTGFRLPAARRVTTVALRLVDRGDLSVRGNVDCGAGLEMPDNGTSMWYAALRSAKSGRMSASWSQSPRVGGEGVGVDLRGAGSHG
jgi:hypothetical protein